MRYFGRIVFCGTSFVGWQNQPNGKSVQSAIENAIAILIQKQIEITGCGRTDAGVHASCYYFHFDTDLPLIKELFSFKLNSMLPVGIHFDELIPVNQDAHARYDAHLRTYRYYICGTKNPFKSDAVFWFRQFRQLDMDKVKRAGEIIAKGEDFFAFSKTNSDVKNHRCQLYSLHWQRISDDIWVMEISANRFLRGMVRLIVGACLNTGLNKVDLSELEAAIQVQQRLKKAWSVPASGLYLCEVKYPFIEEDLTEKTYFFEPFGPFSQ
jgi:tRNA pseudouridine38-40 synthase